MDPFRLPRWGAPVAVSDDPLAAGATVADTAGGAVATLPAGVESKFPYNPTINSKLVLCLEDIWALKVDAICNPTNEAMTERTGVSGHILHAGGAGLLAAIETSEPCRTGEATCTSAGSLPAKFVIHTVGPRYNVKFLTAAENALHNCYRSVLRVAKEHNLRTIALPCLYTQKKGYPRDAGAHVGIRTVRRFLEKFGDGLDLVVLCVASSSDLQIYEQLLPLYCPRSVAEEVRAITLLPEDTGNELGERVLEDRKIRVSSIIGASPGPIARSESEGPVDSKRESEEERLAYSGLGVTPIVQGDPEFTAMLPNPDAAGADPTEAVEDTEEAAKLDAEYERLLTTASRTDLSDIAALNLVYTCGPDRSGFPVLVFLPCNLPIHQVHPERVLMYLVSVLEEFVETPYSVIMIHSELSVSNSPTYPWLTYVHKLLPRSFRKNIQRLYLVYENFWLRTGFMFLRSSISKKFWRKIIVVPSLRDLTRYVAPDSLMLPETVFRWEVARYSVVGGVADAAISSVPYDPATAPAPTYGAPGEASSSAGAATP